MIPKSRCGARLTGVGRPRAHIRLRLSVFRRANSVGGAQSSLRIGVSPPLKIQRPFRSFVFVVLVGQLAFSTVLFGWLGPLHRRGSFSPLFVGVGGGRCPLSPFWIGLLWGWVGSFPVASQSPFNNFVEEFNDFGGDQKDFQFRPAYQDENQQDNTKTTETP